MRHARIMAGLVLAQVVLGIVTLLLAVPLWAGLAHQVFCDAASGHGRRACAHRPRCRTGAAPRRYRSAAARGRGLRSRRDG